MIQSDRAIFRLIATGLAFLAAHPSWAVTRLCGVSNVTVSFQHALDGELVCEAVDQASALFNQCNLPSISRPIRIDVVEELSQGCVALYHCGDHLIEILSARKMEERRDPDGTFRHLSPHDYFQSVVVHELSHAVTDTIPCPFSACVAADEYIAYAMQIMSFRPAAQEAFETGSEQRGPISSDELNVLILSMAPDLFSQKVWAHFSQRDDPCEYIGQLIDRSILLDSEGF